MIFTMPGIMSGHMVVERNSSENLFLFFDPFKKGKGNSNPLRVTSSVLFFPKRYPELFKKNFRTRSSQNSMVHATLRIQRV